jgi:hypothetical protein
LKVLQSCFIRLALWSGALRRLYFFVFNRRYIDQSVARRQGECLRCGTCCKLFFSTCMYLTFDAEGKSSCTKYATFRMPNCKIFPINDSDIRDRNFLSDRPCGYRFNK